MALTIDEILSLLPPKTREHVLAAHETRRKALIDETLPVSMRPARHMTRAEELCSLPGVADQLKMELGAVPGIGPRRAETILSDMNRSWHDGARIESSAYFYWTDEQAELKGLLEHWTEFVHRLLHDPESLYEKEHHRHEMQRRLNEAQQRMSRYYDSVDDVEDLPQRHIFPRPLIRDLRAWVLSWHQPTTDAAS